MDVEEGVFYQIEWGDGTYGNVKVLKVDDTGVHFRLYPNTYPVPVVGLSPDAMKAVAYPHDHRPTIHHLPATRALFESWRPVRWVAQVVKPEELDGYETWLKAKGSYFDLPIPKTARHLQSMILEVANS
jgi:hypothetical protein